ncbi:MAG: NAD-glutamate dehydrogenase domain-containing protein [Syntrophobacteraceae bacterium]
MRKIEGAMEERILHAPEALSWLFDSMPSSFFATMRNETEALTNLVFGLPTLLEEQKLILTDQELKLIVARLDIRGSLYDTIRALQGREISYAEFTHSHNPLPGVDKNLEILRFDFDRRTHGDIASVENGNPPDGIKREVRARLEVLYPDFDFSDFRADLRVLWLNNRDYVLLLSPDKVAKLLWLYQQCRKNDGLFVTVEKSNEPLPGREHSILFSVANPPQKGFLTQIMEILKRLGLGVRRSYSMNVSNGVHWNFLGNFDVVPYEGQSMNEDSSEVKQLKRELYNTQILAAENTAYRVLVGAGVMSGEDASLANAFVAFCQTTLAHCEPDRFDSEMVSSAFFAHPAMVSELIGLFRVRFNPDLKDRDETYERMLRTVQESIENYNTGHKHLDEIRQTIYRTCLLFITHTLKTNFFVPEKHALSFRLDPAYMLELGPEMTRGLPERTPFRITFFFGRRGYGYHIGFSDIARGGWRTIVCRSADELATNTSSLFREVFVLAHTQHLKNKDIYEGGAKLTVILDAVDLTSEEALNQQIYKLQYGFVNAFLDIFVTENGKAKDPRVVDYYGDDEPIELGPDENMHDVMIEEIARQAVKRDYMLGIGIMSSKRIGINHKHYGVTSRGVVKCAAITMNELGVDIYRDPFTVKITGGPNGDVAGNAMRLLLRECPEVRILSITDASGAFYDPEGADAAVLDRLIHRGDIDSFDVESLHPGAFMVYRRKIRQEGLKQLYLKLIRKEEGFEESWITVDEFHRELDRLLFSVPADLLLPCGGRPETINGANCRCLFGKDGAPSIRAIVEGANSFFSPDAREFVQKKSVIIVRDSSANKCGVISSSYEIIANLLMKEAEFLRHKQEYVADVLKILDRRAGDEANLIFKRHRECGGKLLYTEISTAISEEVNAHYDTFFPFFQEHPNLVAQPLYQNVILNHIPDFVRTHPKYRARVIRLPFKIQCAILACELASSIVYHGGWQTDLGTRLEGYLTNRYNWKSAAREQSPKHYSQSAA